MASTFKIFQEGKPIEILPKCKVIHNMPNPPYYLQSFFFYFNNGTTIYASGGGGLSYGSYRDTTITGIKSSSDFPLRITSYEYQADKKSGMTYTTNINSYTYSDYQQGKVLEITINSYV